MTSSEPDNHGALVIGDLMASTLFIVVLALVAYVLTFKGIALAESETGRALYEQRELRLNLLYAIKKHLAARGVRTEIDEEKRLLRFYDDAIPFKSGGMLPELKKAIRALAEVLKRALPCVSQDTPAGRRCARVYPGAVDAVMIEGHSDSIGSEKDNNILSYGRALNVLLMMEAVEPSLKGIRNSRGDPLLAAAAYGESRPLPGLRADSHRNRRIELRVIMRSLDVSR